MKLTILLAAIVTLALLPGCTAYQATVSSREDSLAGYAKDSGDRPSGGVAYTHKVTYR